MAHWWVKREHTASTATELISRQLTYGGDDGSGEEQRSQVVEAGARRRDTARRPIGDQGHQIVEVAVERRVAAVAPSKPSQCALKLEKTAFWWFSEVIFEDTHGGRHQRFDYYCLGLRPRGQIIR